MRITRRGMQIVLALLWLLDGALQLQPFMFGHGFAEQIIAPAGQGQPGIIASAVAWAAGTVDAHPVVWDSLFAAVQLAIGVGLLVRAHGPDRLRTMANPATVLAPTWAALWVGAAMLLYALLGQNSGPDLAAEIRASADGAPGWLAHLDRVVAAGVGPWPARRASSSSPRSGSSARASASSTAGRRPIRTPIRRSRCWARRS